MIIYRKLPRASGWQLVHQQRGIPRAHHRVPAGASTFRQPHNSLLSATLMTRQSALSLARCKRMRPYLC